MTDYGWFCEQCLVGSSFLIKMAFVMLRMMVNYRFGEMGQLAKGPGVPGHP